MAKKKEDNVGLRKFTIETDSPFFEELLCKYGESGYGILLLLLQEIYKVGVYIDYNDQTVSMLANKCICNSRRKIENVEKNIKILINYLLQSNFFDKELFDSYKILTSAQIQDQYKKIKKQAFAKYIETIPEYYLLIEEQESTDKFAEDSQEVILSQYLYEKILTYCPNFKLPNLQEWAKQVDLMVRLDNRSIPDIKKVIDTFTQDLFWRTNILSMKKVREHFDKFSIISNNKNNGNRRVSTFNPSDSFVEVDKL